jgi:hypothetical protein|tara:strand:+ start:144 stop:389 length:246 start_codon:yes stop_codon:yes gene_type:complete
MDFKIGEKIVCIHDSCISGWKNRRLKKNEIYTCNGSFIDEYGDNVILVKEFNHPWLSIRFRKIDYAFADKVILEIMEDAFV